MPSIPIIDAHVHLWEPDRVMIPWLANVPAINARRDLANYQTDTRGIEVQGLVYLQVEVAPPYALLEARDLVRLARANPIIKGVVPWAPLEYGDKVRYFLEELVALGPEIKGVRRIVQDEPDPEFCLQPGFIAGATALSDYGLTADICCNFRQLGANVELVRRCPGTNFILDHIAKPYIRGSEFEPWARQMRDLADLPNVVCKISGVVTEADHDAWTIDDVTSFVHHALDCFGEDRVVFGSDWPVVTLASTFARWVETLDTLTASKSDAARAKLWRDNAITFYRLDS